MKTLTVKLPDPLFAEIEGAARSRRVTKSDIVRERLERGKNENASLWSGVEDLVTEGKSAPRDLSSNKEHLWQYGRSRSDR